MIDTLLIDGDMIVHRSCVAVEKDTRFLDRYHLLFSDEEEAWGVLMETLGELTDLAGTSDVVFCFSDPSRRNWRYEMVWDDYKSARAGQRKPLAYWAVIDRLKRNAVSTRSRDYLEGDDMLGILQTDPNQTLGVTAIWSLDKDLKQIPGFHLQDDEIIEITEQEGDFFHLYQTLAGDVTDGYSGCPGVGNERANSILKSGHKVVPVEHTLKSGPRKGQTEIRWIEEPCEDLWEIVVSHYEKAGEDEALALENARLAKILRHNDYVNGEVQLWTPSST